MTLSAIEAALLLVTEAPKTLLKSYATGIYIEQSSGRSLQDLRHQACADRLQFGEKFLQSGNRLMRLRPIPEYRSAISRYYYAMYHVMRAVAYFSYGGDDHERHDKLPEKTPTDFPDAALWQNSLKNARTLRNEADYDPYPADDRAFRDRARGLRVEAGGLLATARQHLKEKGCTYV